MKSFPLGILFGLIIGVAGAYLVRQHLNAPQVGYVTRYTSGLNTPPVVATAFEKYGASEVLLTTRTDSPVYRTESFIAGVRSSEGRWQHVENGNWQKDGLWIAYDPEENVVGSELWDAGTISQSLQLSADGQVNVLTYRDGIVIENQHGQIQSASE